ncbi:helix-turn-helix domain-containing protein [Chryseobacterium arachidis]|nr:helix-turn-helix domain-containing protein [Chryseobacterium arachidis]
MKFYCISLKKNITGKTKYGREYYDYDKGIMTFVSPMQTLSLEGPHMETDRSASGFALFIHPDFLSGHSLSTMDKDYGFFSYSVNEALHLSEKEEENTIELFLKIAQEYESTDQHSRQILLAQIELLLSYCNRFYMRQFETRKVHNNSIIDKLDHYLNNHFDAQDSLRVGIPSVEAIAEMLNVSTHYLSDLMRSMTGYNTQQYIQNRLLEKAKEYLHKTDLSVAEIAYLLGFEYPQSFNKLFKKKVNLSPLEFRRSFL